MCNRENIYTQFARDINKFAEHKLTKADLYNSFVAMVEMSNEEERQERIKHNEYVKSADGDLAKLNDIPHSNWYSGLQMVE
jgi:hypothetical protein